MDGLWPHQSRALKYLAENKWTLIWGEMGSGKTRIVIEHIVQNQFDLVLIVCPKQVIPVWIYQFSLFSGIKPEVVTKSNTMLSSGVWVINYDMVWRLKFLLTQDYGLIVADECHRIKAPGSKVSRFMGRLAKRSLRRIGMSGTPVVRDILDLYGQFRFIDSTIYGTRYDLFRDQYAVMGGYFGYEVVDFKNLDEFHAKLNSRTIRFEGVTKDLPDFIDQVYPVVLPPAVKKAYDSLKKKSIVSLSQRTVAADNVLIKLVRLQQITSGYLPVENSLAMPLHDGKINALQEVIEDSDEPLVVFCRFRYDIQQIERLCKRKGIKPAIIPGDGYERFIHGDSRVLIAQIQTGSEGIDLTMCGDRQCRRAVFYSNTFWSSQYWQARKRIHRPGQKQTCHYIHLVAANTIDERIYEVLKSRKNVADELKSVIPEGLEGEIDE